MRILFYLPNVTPWWFDHRIAPMVRALAAAAEVQVMAPPLWRSTGVTADQLAPFAEGPHVEWHILDESDPALLRTAGSRDPKLLARVQGIAADIILCRCADPDAIPRFPGHVRYIMEGESHPLSNGGEPVIFPTGLFEFGTIPALTGAETAALERGFAPIWAHFEAAVRHRRVPSWRAAAGVEPGRPVVAVPLEYAFEDSLTAAHQHYPSNLDLIDDVAAHFGEDVFLAFTNHPLNELYGDNDGVAARIAALGARAGLIRSRGRRVRASELVARDCDAAVVDLTKTYLAYAYYGVPIARPTRLPTATWLNAARDLPSLATALRRGRATPPAPDRTRLWFAHHLANDLLDAGDPNLDADRILDHLLRPSNPARWAANLDRFARRLPHLDAAGRRLAA